MIDNCTRGSASLTGKGNLLNPFPPSFLFIGFSFKCCNDNAGSVPNRSCVQSKFLVQGLHTGPGQKVVSSGIIKSGLK